MEHEPKLVTPIARFFAEYAKETKYNYRDLAHLLGFSATSVIYDLVEGRGKFPIDKVEILAEITGEDRLKVLLLVLQQHMGSEFYSELEDRLLTPPDHGDESAEA